VPSLRGWEALGIVTQFGVTCAVAVWLGFILGNWLDGLLGTSVIFSLLFALGGMISAVTSTYQLLQALGRREAARKARGQE
jgi:F0F1-type ATP synthase assembly protein I